jgi:putative ATPase
VIAAHVDAAWTELSAVTAGVKDVRRIIEEGRARLELRDRRTVLFVDEIHRFNKGQQDALLPGVEAGWVTLIGATTENPFFELNAPLLSRCQLVRLEALDGDDLRTCSTAPAPTRTAASAAASPSTRRRSTTCCTSPTATPGRR